MGGLGVSPNHFILFQHPFTSNWGGFGVMLILLLWFLHPSTFFKFGGFGGHPQLFYPIPTPIYVQLRGVRGYTYTFAVILTSVNFFQEWGVWGSPPTILFFSNTHLQPIEGGLGLCLYYWFGYYIRHLFSSMGGLGVSPNHFILFQHPFYYIPIPIYVQLRGVWGHAYTIDLVITSVIFFQVWGVWKSPPTILSYTNTHLRPIEGVWGYAYAIAVILTSVNFFQVWGVWGSPPTILSYSNTHLRPIEGDLGLCIHYC
jgi:hypothetical protein